MSSPTIKPIAEFDTVCDALRDVHDEASLWTLSDELVKVAPKGVEAVEKVVAQAKVRGIPTKSANTLRLYRDVAHRFPRGKRVPLVSFSAHREAIAIGDTDQAHDLLVDLAKRHGAEGVSVTTVKDAVQKATGKTPTTTPKAAKASTTYADIATDLCVNSGKKFIAEVDTIVLLPKVSLDGLHAGLTAVLTAIEAKRAKAARAAAKKAAGPTTAKPVGKPATRRPSTSPAKAAATAGKGKGDLRDL
jgi:hypothetical protein